MIIAGMYLDVTKGVPSTTGRPRIVKVIDTEVSLMWTQPDSDGGSKITGYLIAYVTASGCQAQDVTVGVTTTAKVKKTISQGTAYIFAVAAQNARGFGDFSAFSEEVEIPNYADGNLFL